MIDGSKLAPIRTRGRLPELAEVAKHGAQEIGAAAGTGASLRGLINRLRRDVGGISITVVVHGYGSQATTAFLGWLSPLLRDDDVLLLIPGSHAQGPAEPTVGGFRSTVLKPGEPGEDQRDYENRLVELVFFPCLERQETVWAEKWRGGARAAVINSQPPEQEFLLRVLQVAQYALLLTFLWAGGQELQPA